jgi:hypothetical protein
MNQRRTNSRISHSLSDRNHEQACQRFHIWTPASCHQNQTRRNFFAVRMRDDRIAIGARTVCQYDVLSLNIFVVSQRIRDSHSMLAEQTPGASCDPDI